MFDQLAKAYSLLEDDAQLRVGVLCAAGEHFTAGLDLPTFAGLMQRGEQAIADGEVDPVDLGTPGLRQRSKPLVVAAGTELGRALQIAKTIAEQAPLAVAATQQSVLQAIEHGPMAARVEFDEIQKKLAHSADAAEGVRSFSEKRAAVFKGC